MKAWSTFLDYVMPWAPAVEQLMAEHAIKLAAISFFHDSRCDRRALSSIATVADSATPITLTLPSGTEIVRVERVRIADGDDLDPLATTDVSAEMLNDSGMPTHYQRSASSSKLVVYPTPDAIYTLLPTVSIKPTLAATGVDSDDLANRYAREIGWGAIGLLLSMPKKPWSDMTAASFYMRTAAIAAIEARHDSETGDTDAPQRTRSVFGLR